MTLVRGMERGRTRQGLPGRASVEHMGESDAGTATGGPEIPRQVFEKFLADLVAAGHSTDLVSRLRKCLVEEAAFGERALRAAVVPEELKK